MRAGGTRTTGQGSWFADHAVDMVFILLVLAAYLYSVRITNGRFFWLDEWPLMKQGRSLTGLFDQYNGALSTISLGVYRVLPQLFGFNYTPVRVVGFASLFAVPLAYYLTTRRQFGAVLAALLALPLVWYGQHVDLNPNELNHNCALLGGVVCAAALNRGRRADWVLAAALVFSFFSAGGAVAVAAACLVHCVCTRAPLRRWFVVIVPSLLWLTWWLVDVGSTGTVFALSTSQKIRLARDIAFTPFQAFAMNNTVLAVILLIVFIGLAIWTLTKGLNAGANFLAWSAAVVVWTAGLVTSRGGFATAETFRYRYGALLFVLLAVVPRRPIVWPARFPITTDKRWLFAGAAVVLVLGAARGLAVRSDLQHAAQFAKGVGNISKGQVLVVELGPSVVPDDRLTALTLGGLPAGTLRSLLSKYDDPLGVTRSTIDQKSVDLGVVRFASDTVRAATCKKLTTPYKYQSSGFGYQFFSSPDSSYAVDVRRFGRDGCGSRTARPEPGCGSRCLRWAAPSHGRCVPSVPAEFLPRRPPAPRRPGDSATMSATVERPGPEAEFSPYLEGVFAPIADEIDAECVVVSDLPEDLVGVFVRNGSNPMFTPKGRYHWFDGDGMLHALHLENGRATYRNRYVRTDALAAEQAASDALWTGINERPEFSQPGGPFKDTANTDLVFHAGRLLAPWWLGGPCYEVAPPWLETVGQ